MKFVSLVVVLLLMCSAGFASEVRTTTPNTQSELLLPATYRNWVTVSPSTPGMPNHHHSHVASKLFVEPIAFEQFAKTGKWPNKTVIVLELTSAHPKSKGDVMGLEAAVKDDSHFPDPWTYYGIVFDHPQEKAPAAKAQKMCDCDQPLEPMLAMAFPTLRAVINAKPSAVSPMLF